VSDRVDLKPGDFFKDALPTSADVVLLSGILHNWSPTEAHAILRQCRQAMKAGDTLLISEQILNDQKTSPSLAVLCSLNMLVMLGGAREYSRSEFKNMLSTAGFSFETVQPTGGFRELIIARAST
jgi:hypothetical protein